MTSVSGARVVRMLADILTRFSLTRGRTALLLLLPASVRSENASPESSRE